MSTRVWKFQLVSGAVYSPEFLGYEDDIEWDVGDMVYVGGEVEPWYIERFDQAVAHLVRG